MSCSVTYKDKQVKQIPPCHAATKTNQLHTMQKETENTIIGVCQLFHEVELIGSFAFGYGYHPKQLFQISRNT